jgi:hypothetical protein
LERPRLTPEVLRALDSGEELSSKISFIGGGHLFVLSINLASGSLKET